MRRGEIRLADLERAVGAEAAKRRPVVVVSNNGANAGAVRFGRGVVTVVPLTSNVEQVRTFQVLLPSAASGLRRDSKAQVEQVRAVDVSRLGDCLGDVPRSLMNRIDDALRLHLGL